MTQQIFFDSTQKIGFKSDVIFAQSLANVQINTCDKYVTSHIHEQILVIDIFCLPHKSWQTSFSANVFATKNPSKCPHVHEQIKLVT